MRSTVHIRLEERPFQKDFKNKLPLPLNNHLRYFHKHFSNSFLRDLFQMKNFEAISLHISHIIPSFYHSADSPRFTDFFLTFPDTFECILLFCNFLYLIFALMCRMRIEKVKWFARKPSNRHFLERKLKMDCGFRSDFIILEKWTVCHFFSKALS